MAKRLKVIVTDYIESDMDWEAQQLDDAHIRFAACQLKFRPEQEVLDKVIDADVIVVNMVKMPASLIAKLEKCKLIIRHGIGYDNVDVPACTEKGIIFAYQPDYCQEDVTEHAISLIFACGRKLFLARRTLEESSASGQWDFSDLFPVYRMAGKTLGIVGVGRIGSRVYLKLKSFGFNIIGCDPYLSDQRREELQIPLVELEQLLGESDFVTLHTPLNEETRHIINAQTLNLMKETAYLINTSRGPMVDVQALAAALARKQIAGAALDVYDSEPPPMSYPFFAMKNVILTPHMGWASEESGWEIRRSIIDDIMSFAAGRPPRCVVNQELLDRKE